MASPLLIVSVAQILPPEAERWFRALFPGPSEAPVVLVEKHRDLRHATGAWLEAARYVGPDCLQIPLDPRQGPQALVAHATVCAVDMDLADIEEGHSGGPARAVPEHAVFPGGWHVWRSGWGRSAVFLITSPDSSTPYPYYVVVVGPPDSAASERAQCTAPFVG